MVRYPTEHLWGEGEFDYNGQYYRVTGTNLYPKPYAGQPPTILCAGYSEQGRDFAARNAGKMFTAIRENLERHRQI
ncbi:MAG: hypothetical protein Ct9H300mP27_03900 [Chloroflexota bacterium]|nr:MAG: hypothetical protein Ct9H300mP27_03900 [Chloroflexota bacterium]